MERKVLAWITAAALLAGCSGGGGSGAGTASQSARCGSDPVFTVSPLASTDFTGLVPLGNLNPSGHVLPTDHLYFYLASALQPVEPKTAQVLSPGAVTITQLNTFEYLSASPSYTDYTIDFSPCDEVKARFQHVTSLSAAVSGQLGTPDACTTYTTGGTTVRLCRKSVAITVNAGDVLGTISTVTSGALDFGATDSQVTLAMANPSRDPSTRLHAVCPVDYFTTTVRDALRARFGKHDGSTLRTTPPVCGEVVQDVAGTAQGAWYARGSPNSPEDPHLALVHDNVTPSIAVFSVGASVTGASSRTYTFTPTSSGLVNRDFNQVTPDGNVYCYTTSAGASNAVFVLQMTSATALRIEAKSGNDCASASQVLTATAKDFDR